MTTRLTTDNAGTLSNEQAHYPYGEQWYATGTANPSVPRKFTTYMKEDEAATGKLNYAIFREHSARIGRFNMVDAVRDVSNPQSLNGYPYGQNDPISGSGAPPHGCDEPSCKGGDRADRCERPSSTRDS